MSSGWVYVPVWEHDHLQHDPIAMPQKTVNYYRRNTSADRILMNTVHLLVIRPVLHGYLLQVFIHENLLGEGP